MGRRLLAAFAVTAFGRWLSRNVFWKLDPVLLRLSGGRVASTLLFPAGLLETRGARTGELRRHAVIWFRDDDRTIVVASNAGAPRHPAWWFNLQANPDVTFQGVPMTASEVVDPDELRRLWQRADEVFPGYPRYREDAARTGRTIPVVALRPREA